jgi:hypothetical protein
MVVECSEANKAEHQEKMGESMCNLLQIVHVAPFVGNIAVSNMIAIPTIIEFVERELPIVLAKGEGGVFRVIARFGLFLGGN